MRYQRRGAPDPLQRPRLLRHMAKIKWRPPVGDNYERKEFATVAERNEFYAAMKAIKAGTVRYSTVAGNRSVFVCAWPRRVA